ncbi:MAG: BMP family lipoprotein [Eubacteriales bacterium]|jgi:basic membrane protein A
MKKYLAFTLILAIVLSLLTLAGCNKAGSNKFELALVTDLGTIDDKSFNQGSWEGLKAYAEDHDLKYQYYQPAEGTNAAYLEAIDLAIKGGAKVVVTPGFLFEVPIYEAQKIHPETMFILIDGEPHNEDYSDYNTESNVLNVLYAEQEAGFFAGYAAVKDGFTKLGFQGGMAVPAVIRYGYGFLQGADAAAKELGLGKDSIEVRYNYSGDFDATPENQARAAGWYADGTEIIFACGGSVGNSVMTAAEASTDKWVIGVDVDQYNESETVISSAMKMLGHSVYMALESFYDNKWEGGTTWRLDSTNDGVGLAMENAKWRTFSDNDYSQLFEAVKSGKYEINDDTTVDVVDLQFDCVKVIPVSD